MSVFVEAGLFTSDSFPVAQPTAANAEGKTNYTFCNQNETETAHVQPQKQSWKFADENDT